MHPVGNSACLLVATPLQVQLLSRGAYCTALGWPFKTNNHPPENVCCAAVKVEGTKDNTPTHRDPHFHASHCETSNPRPKQQQQYKLASTCYSTYSVLHNTLYPLLTMIMPLDCRSLPMRSSSPPCQHHHLYIAALSTSTQTKCRLDIWDAHSSLYPHAPQFVLAET